MKGGDWNSKSFIVQSSLVLLSTPGLQTHKTNIVRLKTNKNKNTDHQSYDWLQTNKSNNTDCYLVIVVGAQVAAVTALIPAFPQICFSQENIENIENISPTS